MPDQYETEIRRLSKLDVGAFERFLGAPFINSIEGIENTDRSSVLAELLIIKLGPELFDKRPIRLATLDTLRKDELIGLGEAVGIDNKILSEIYDYFESNFNEIKSRQLVDYLGFSNKFYRRKIVDDRKDVETVDVNFGDPVELKGFLHPYQKNIKDQILNSLIGPGTRLMVQMPTGAGKTYTALETAVDILRRPYQKKFIVWMVHRNELAEQALSSFSELWKTKGDRPLNLFRWFHRFVPDFSQYPDGGVVFATYDLFASVIDKLDDERRPRLLHLIQNTAYLIVDEAHSSIAETHAQCVNYFISNDQTQIVGLSASPFREDPDEREALRRLYSDNLIGMQDLHGNPIGDPIRYLQDFGALAKLNVDVLETGIQLPGNNENKLLKELAENTDRNRSIIGQLELANSIPERTLVFACTKDHVLALYVLCKKANIPAGVIIGDTPQSDRMELLNKFNDGELGVLINYDILSAGIDLPKVERLILTRPVRSTVEYSQIVGRVLRGPLNGGRGLNTIVNIKDNVNFFSDVSLVYNSFKNTWGG